MCGSDGDDIKISGQHGVNDAVDGAPAGTVFNIDQFNSIVLMSDLITRSVQFLNDQLLRAVGKAFGGNDCCRAQGPEGLVVAAKFAVRESGNSVTVNLFEALDSGALHITGNYPFEPQVKISFDDPENKILRLRTPAFLRSVKFNGISVEFTPGVYLELSHKGGAADTVELEFDFTLKEILSPDGKFTAVMRGPLVLAEDSRGKVADSGVSVQWRGRELCEYATAGNLIGEENTLTVWFRNGQ